MFFHDAKDAVLAVRPVICFHGLRYRAQQAKLTVIKVIQWRLVLHGQALDSYFRSYTPQTVVSVNSAAAPRPSCCPPGRCDFLPWGFSRTSAGCQTHLGELLACPFSPSVHFSPLLCADLRTWQMKALWLCTEIIVSSLPPCCYNGDDNRATASKRAAERPQAGGSGWRAVYTGTLLHIQEECNSSQLITQTCLTLLLEYMISSGGKNIHILCLSKSINQLI